MYKVRVWRSHAALDEDIASILARLEQSKGGFLSPDLLTDIEETARECHELRRHGDALELEAWAERAVYEHVLTPRVFELEKQLREAVEYDEEGDRVLHRQTVLDDLRTMLLLTGPREPQEPGLIPAQQRWLVTSLLAAWRGRTKTMSEEDSRVATSILGTVLDRMRDRTCDLLPRDPSVVRHARDLLEDMQADEHMLAHFFPELVTAPAPVMPSLVDPPYKNDYTPSPFYTRMTWESRIRPRLERFPEENEDGWVSGQPEWPSKAAELQALYFERYINAWDSAVRGIYVDLPVSNPRDGMARLSAMVDVVPSPLHAFLKRLAYETQLENAALAIPEAQAKLRPAIDHVGREFQDLVAFDRGGGTDRVIEFLERLRDALRVEEENYHDYQAYAEVNRILDQPGPEFESIVKQRGKWSSVLENLIFPLANTRWRVSGDSGDEFLRAYCPDVWQPFRKEILPMFPFSEQGPDLDLAALDRILNPRKGAWLRIYEGFVCWRIVRTDEGHAIIDPPRRFGHWHPSLLGFMARVDILTRALYRPQLREAFLGFAFEARVLPAPGPYEVEFTLGETVIKDGDWTSLSWPQSSDDLAMLRFRRHDGRRPYTLTRRGVWAWFRLLALASLSRADGRLVARWDLEQRGAGVVEVEFRGADSNPFFAASAAPGLLLDVFREFEVPPDLRKDSSCADTEARLRKAAAAFPVTRPPRVRYHRSMTGSARLHPDDR